MKRVLMNVIFIIFSAFSWKLCLGDAGDIMGVANLTALQVIEKYGYPKEAHKVETEDGYILELHRIPHGRSSNSTRKIPVLLMHGLFGTSAQFLGVEHNSLALLIADAGYDVWLGNFRGNRYSMAHKYLSYHDQEFWNFSWHEHGVFDIPASIDYVRNYTKSDEVLFVGYSMGVTAFLAMATIRPEYQKKIRGVISLGPAAAEKHTRSPLRLLAPFYFYSTKVSRKIFEIEDILVKSQEIKNTTELLCYKTRGLHLCRSFAFFIAGPDDAEFEEGKFNTLLAHFYSYTSQKTIAHYSQLVLTGKFRKFNYGLVKNLKKYGQALPPEYDLRLVTAPLSLFLAPNDYFVTRRDLRYLLERLNSVKAVYVVPFKKFTHLDFMMAKHAKSLLYDKVLQQLEFLVKEGKNATSLKNFEHIYPQIHV